MIEIKPDGLGSSRFWKNPLEEEEESPRKFYTFSTYREYIEHMIDQSPDFVREGLDVLLNSWEMGIEAQRLFFNPIHKDKNLPRGDGSFVGIVPGFLGNKFSYSLPKENLVRLNWNADVFPVKYFTHIEPTEDMIVPLIQFAREKKKSSGRKIHLIGHSKGGHVILAAAMLMTHELAESVDQIVIVDSPIPNKVNLQVGIGYLIAQAFFGGNDFRLTGLADDTAGLERIEQYFRLTTLKVKNGTVIDGLHIGSPENQFEVVSSHPGAVHKPENLLLIHSRLVRPAVSRSTNGHCTQAA